MTATRDAKARLADGNAVFRKSSDPLVMRRLAGKHQPYVAILTCADARVDPLRVFGLSMGDAFVVRVAGNTTIDRGVLGSLEYAVGHLGVGAVVVLGHSDCGAIKTLLEGQDGGNLSDVMQELQCARDKLHGCSDRDQTAIAVSNVRLQLRMLEDRSSTIREAVCKGRLSLHGAMLELSTGKVEFI